MLLAQDESSECIRADHSDDLDSDERFDVDPEAHSSENSDRDFRGAILSIPTQILSEGERPSRPRFWRVLIPGVHSSMRYFVGILSMNAMP